MTVGELIAQLHQYDSSRIVIMSGDGEGNDFSPLADLTPCAYQAETTWSGTAGPEALTDEMREQGYTEEDIVDGKPALCLYPVN